MSYLLSYSKWRKVYEVANGEIPRDDLDVIPVLPGESQRHALNPVAAEAYAKMVAAAKEDGVEWGITDSYRPLEVQVRLAKQKGLYSQGGLAAAPGTSNHGWGSAVDLNFKVGKGNQFQWLKDNASNFGFNNIPREPWHWEHKESAKQVKGGNLPSTNTPPPSGKTVAPTTSRGSSALLKIGATGEEVTKVQAKLSVTQSGNYDAATAQAVRKFQSENKDTSGAPLKVDGIVGPITYGALFGVQISPEVIAKASPTQVNQVNQVDVILMGGLDYRPDDLKIDKQVELLNSGTSGGKKILGHRYTELTKVLDSIAQNPNAKVVLFSAGGTYSKQVANAMQNKSNLYIVEPYAADADTKTSVQSAVTAGVPSKNVLTGSSVGRGKDVITGATMTPSNKGHWDALQYVGSLI